jgi:hypothetical protein
MRRLATFTILVSLAALAGNALAEPPSFADCGIVKTYVPPTGATAGSITIGNKTVALAAADRVPADRAPIGQVMCLHQTATTSGPVLELLELLALPTPLCGTSDSLPFDTLTPDRIDLQIAPGFRAVFFTAPGLRVPSVAPGSRLCFETGVNAAGWATIFLVVSATPAATPTAAPRTLPSTSAANFRATPRDWLTRRRGTSRR